MRPDREQSTDNSDITYVWADSSDDARSPSVNFGGDDAMYVPRRNNLCRVRWVGR